MAHIKAQFLLFRLASAFYQEQESVSKQEILKKINEIKYLSEQKKVPRFQLQKEITHLEHKLNVVFSLEQKLAQQRRHESMRIAALKKEIASLRQRLALAQDPDFCSKVERVAHTVGSLMAQRDTKAMIDAATGDVSRQQKINLMQNKVEKLEALLEVQRKLDPAKAALLEKRISDIKQKLGIVSPSIKRVQSPTSIDMIQETNEPILVQEQSPPSTIIDLKSPQRHNILFTLPPQQQQKWDDADMSSEKEMKLPPPPKWEM